MAEEKIGEPRLLTITDMDNPRQTCKRHYEIWYFVAVDKHGFNPDPKLLAKEFHEMLWLSPDEARERVKTQCTLDAIDRIEGFFVSE